MAKPTSAGIVSWPETERPRERLLAVGEHALTDAELLAILLRVGVKGASAVELGHRILLHFGSLAAMARADESEWRGIHGLGTAKIAQIKAALELGRRSTVSKLAPQRHIANSDDARAYFLARMRDLPREHFRVLLLNRRHRIIEDFLADEGTVHGAVPSVREILARAIQGGASALIAAHNHPAGSPDPSAEDIAWTRQLVAAAEPLEICVVDHLIVTHDQVTSMAEIGLLKKLLATAKRAAEPIGDTH
jgi:DNA repair protein RadC